jgi:ribonuclease BN (tRNA processing enzyme)
VALTLTILGCDGSYPGPGGAGSGFLIRGGGATVWLDCGPGTLANLQRHVAIEDVDAIVCTHVHPDHRSDLEGFAVANEYFLHRTGFDVFAPAQVFEAGYHTEEPALRHHVIDDGSTWTVGGLTFTASRTDHVETTLAVRIDGEGRSMAYSADTGPRWSLTSLGPPVDLALVEASYLAHGEAMGLDHLSGRLAGLLAREARVPRLVLTHVWPTVDREAVRIECTAVYDGTVVMAEIGATFEV